MERIQLGQDFGVFDADEHDRLERACRSTLQFHSVRSTLPPRPGYAYGPFINLLIARVADVKHTTRFNQMERITGFVQHVRRDAVGTTLIAGAKGFNVEAIVAEAQKRA